jgi:hypothetical protein
VDGQGLTSGEISSRAIQTEPLLVGVVASEEIQFVVRLNRTSEVEWRPMSFWIASSHAIIG